MDPNRTWARKFRVETKHYNSPEQLYCSVCRNFVNPPYYWIYTNDWGIDQYFFATNVCGERCAMMYMLRNV
jgi:hypothetical protein